MAAPLNTCTTIEQRGVVRFLWAKNMDAAKDIHCYLEVCWKHFLHRWTNLYWLELTFLCFKLLSCSELLVTCNKKTSSFSLFCVWTCTCVHLLVHVMAVQLQSLQLFLGLWLCQTRSSATGCRKIQVSNPLGPVLSSWKALLQLSGLCSARESKSSEYCRVLGATVGSESILNLQ
jgi:hypothetical protein